MFRKFCDIFCDVHDSRKRVVGLIYTKQFVAFDRVVRCKSPYTIISGMVVSLVVFSSVL